MSYSGSQQQFGLSDMQLLQQHVMLARLQEFQKQQQLGQLGDVKTASSLNNMTLFGNQTVGPPLQNLGSGTSYNAPQMFGSCNLNWTSNNVCSPLQASSRGSPYSHDEGLVMNPTLQQPDISLYAMPVATGRGYLGQYSPTHEVTYSSSGMLSVVSNEKPVTQVLPSANPFMGNKCSFAPGHGYSLDKSLMLRQGLQEKLSAGQASFQTLNNGVSPQIPLQMNSLQEKVTPQECSRRHRQPGGAGILQELARKTNNSEDTAILDPLEEKILFDTEDSGWDTSFSKLAAIGCGDFVSSSGHTESTNAFASVQSGSWSALVQSAVGEASSSDTGMQEELSGLSFQHPESSSGKEPSNFATIGQQHGKWTDSKFQSSSYNPRVPPSAADLTSTHPSQWSESQQQLDHPVTAGQLNWVALNDVSQRSRPSAPLVAGMARNKYEFFQQAAEGHLHVPGTDDTLDHKDDKSIRYGFHRLSSSPMAVEAHYKRAAENQNSYPGENSSDSYNSKLSQAHRAQLDHASSNAEDSESSARSSYKSQNQALFMSSPGANSQQECLSHLKSANSFPTNANSMIKGKSNLLTDGLLRDSLVSDISVSFDSQCTSELNKANPPRDRRSVMQFGSSVSQADYVTSEMPNISNPQGKPNPDIFSFQSSVKGDVSLGNGQNGRTWWTPSSFGHSFPPLRGASLSESWSGNFSVLGKPTTETSSLSNEKNSHAASLPGSLYLENQLESKLMPNVSVASERIWKTFPETGQQISLSGNALAQDSFLSKHISSFGREYSVSGGFPITKSQIMSGTSHQGMKPFSASINVQSRGDVMADPGKVLSDQYSSGILSVASHVATSAALPMPKQSSLVSLPAWSSVTGKGGSKEQIMPVIQNFDFKGLESAEKYLRDSADASMYMAKSLHQQGYITTAQTDRSPAGTTSEVLHACSQPQQSHNFILESMKKKMNTSISANMAEADVSKVEYESSAVSILNKQQNPEVQGQRPQHVAHMLARNPLCSELNVASQFNPPSSSTNILAFSSAASNSLLENAPSLSALQYIYSHKLPVFGHSNPQGYTSETDMISDQIRHLQIRAQTAPAWYSQHEYLKNGQMLSLSESAALSSGKPSDTVQLNGTTSATKNSAIVPGLPKQVVIPLEGNKSPVLIRTKKRKTAMYDFLPWHKKVMQPCQELPDISTAEQEWAEATNRLIEKGVNEAEANLEAQPLVRAKRRLILTTQLMQQVFRPPTPAVLSVDAGAEYDIVAYSAAKFALADACSLANKTGTASNKPSEYGNMATYARTTDNPFRKAALQLADRTDKLESQLDRLYRSISVVDVRVECQDLEKFCVINHFAKYHSRVIQRPDPGSSTTGVASFRPFLQRYVTAIPLPQKLPEGVQCLSL